MSFLYMCNVAETSESLKKSIKYRYRDVYFYENITCNAIISYINCVFFNTVIASNIHISFTLVVLDFTVSSMRQLPTWHVTMMVQVHAQLLERANALPTTFDRSWSFHHRYCTLQVLLNSVSNFLLLFTRSNGFYVHIILFPVSAPRHVWVFFSYLSFILDVLEPILHLLFGSRLSSSFLICF